MSNSNYSKFNAETVFLESICAADTQKPAMQILILLYIKTISSQICSLKLLYFFGMKLLCYTVVLIIQEQKRLFIENFFISK